MNFRKPHQLGILGMNQRNGDYVMAYNPRHLYPLVDDKMRTKELALQAGIAVPELYALIRMEHDNQKLGNYLSTLDSFVIKPAHGSGGKGIVVIDSRYKDAFRKASGDVATLDELKHHVSNILSGMHSLGGLPDQALIEYRVQFDPVFANISYRGVPDVRMIMFRGVPIMAMLRLPTRRSDGKANLHQGAVGVGIHLNSGVTYRGVQSNNVILEHPDSGYRLSGLTIPHWENMLFLAAHAYELAPLGYMGVDIVLDEHKGPLILELNARPGLSIQVANGAGLKPRLKWIERLGSIPSSAQLRVQMAMEMLDAITDPS